MLSDTQITARNFIRPFHAGPKQPGVISYGLTSYGYDFRLGFKFKVFKGYPCNVIDPKNFDENCMESVDLTGHTPNCITHVDRECGLCNCNKYLDIPPHAFVLAETIERVAVPRDVLCVIIGKSTYARCGLIVNCTPLEPEWEGVITLELSNTTSLPLRVYAGEGIAQGVFLVCSASCQTSYADKKGKYQHQIGLTTPRM